MHAQGLTVDDDNEPDKENTNKPPPQPTGQWIKPTTCCHASQGHVKTKGRWINTSWDVVKEFNKLQLFLLCFPVDFIKSIVLLRPIST
jgi:hypothetical protein